MSFSFLYKRPSLKVKTSKEFSLTQECMPQNIFMKSRQKPEHRTHTLRAALFRFPNENMRNIAKTSQRNTNITET